jgi:hypothetical protein
MTKEGAQVIETALWVVLWLGLACILVYAKIHGGL